MNDVEWMPLLLAPVTLLGWLALGWWCIRRTEKKPSSVVPSGTMLKRIGKGAIVVAVFGAALYCSTRAAIPEPLPGVAMGWTALFHVERAGALLGAIGIVALISWRALSGEFPVKFGNVEYAAKEAAAEAEEISESQERRIRVLEVLMSVRDPASLENDR